MSEVLSLANEVANDYITDRRGRAIASVLNAEVCRNWGKLPHLVGEANSWIDMDFGGSFDCTHFTFDKCGDLVKPNAKSTVLGKKGSQ